jgi:hypothetical protein
MRRRWDIGGGCPAVTGGAVSAPGGLGEAANENGAKPLESADGRAVIRPAERMVRLSHVGRAGLAMSVSLPLGHYRGVAADIEIDERAIAAGYRLVLAHADPALDIELYRAADDCDLVAEWRGLARDLGLPMLMRSDAGDVLARPRLGMLDVGLSAPRRAPRAFLKRRPKALRRRKVGVVRSARG